MDFANPFALPGYWFKGCLHVHSTASDGCLTPEEVIDWYRSRGYHFLALTDHGVLSEAQSLGDGFITLSGIEVERIDPLTGEYHIVGLGLNRAPNLNGGQNLPLQEAINRLRATGALVSLAHPYWTGQMSKDLLGLEGCFALEVYNGGCEIDDARGFSIVHWDDLLAAGHRLWGLAVDDAHWYNGSKDAGLGWVWVKAPALAQEASSMPFIRAISTRVAAPRSLTSDWTSHLDSYTCNALRRCWSISSATARGAAGSQHPPGRP